MSSSIAQQPLIQVVDLSWQVKDKMILQQLSFTVNKGQILGVIGPNGAGKTSLLRCLLNQQNDFSGDVYFKNKKLCHYNTQQIAKSFAVVTQKATPIFALSVFDVVRMGLLPHKGLLASVRADGIPRKLLVLSEAGILLTHQSVRSWLNDVAPANIPLKLLDKDPARLTSQLPKG